MFGAFLPFPAFFLVTRNFEQIILLSGRFPASVNCLFVSFAHLCIALLSFSFRFVRVTPNSPDVNSVAVSDIRSLLFGSRTVNLVYGAFVEKKPLILIQTYPPPLF